MGRIASDLRRALRLAGSSRYVVCVPTPHQRKISAIVSKLLDWYPKNARDLPWRRTNDPYCVFVSEIMLQQTQVKTVIPYFERWMRALPNIQALAQADAAQLHKLWEGLGYYTRVRNMQRAARVIVDRHQGVFPTDYDAVLDLPGIGPYTAGAICSIAFNQPTAILDGNVVRVLSRLFALKGNPREPRLRDRLWALAAELVTRAKAVKPPLQTGDARPLLPCSALNQSLMELGALICTPRNPQCAICPLSRLCVACARDQATRFPQLPARPTMTARRFVAFIAQRADRFLVRQRPAGVVNAHLWEFPNIEIDASNTPLETAAAAVLGQGPRTLQPAGVIKHTITRFRITLEVYRATGLPEKNHNAQWLSRHQLLRLPFTSAHKKILTHLTPDS